MENFVVISINISEHKFDITRQSIIKMYSKIDPTSSVFATCENTAVSPAK